MTRLRLLLQRIHRAGDIAICRMNGGYVVVTERFNPYCSEVMTKREAIQHAARCAMPSKPIRWEGSEGRTTSIYTTHQNGSTSVSIMQR